MPDMTGAFGRGTDSPPTVATPIGVLGTMAMPQIVNEVRSWFGLEPDRFPNTADPTGAIGDWGLGGSGPEGGGTTKRKLRSIGTSPFARLGAQ